MAKMEMVVRFNKYRPCLVKGKKAIFHRWCEVAEIRDAVLKGTISGQIKNTYGIVEFEDGSIGQYLPCYIKFCDNLVKDYGFRVSENE